MSAFARSALIAAALVVAVLGGRVAAAAAAGPGDADRLGLGTTWMVRHQSSDGGLPAPASGGIPAVTHTEIWAALGLAAAGVNAQAQHAAGSGRSLYAVLADQFAPLASSTADVAYLVLVAHAVGADAEHVGTSNINLIAALLAARVPDVVGGYANPDAGGYVAQAGTALPSAPADAQATALASLALSAFAREPGHASFVPDAVTAAGWLVARQSADGSWPGPAGPDTETTALAVEAIAASGLAAGPSIGNARLWLASRQNADGGFGTGAGGAASDTLATAAAARALAAAGVDPAGDVNSDNNSPLTFLGGVQDTSGRIDTEGSVGPGGGRPTDNPTLTTAYAMIAFAHRSFPLAPVTGAAGGDPPPQRPPLGLPTGPPLPVASPPPAATPAPAAPSPSAPPAPTIERPRVAPAGAAPSAGVRRIKTKANDRPKAKPETSGDGSGGTASAGDGSGGGGGTLSTPGAPARAGGGGGTASAAPSRPTTTAGTPLPTTGHQGGTPTKTTNKTPQEVSGTLIGHDSATPGAKGSTTAAPGAAGRAGGHTTPWWAVALATLIAAGLLTGLRLDRRRPHLAL